MTVLRSRAVAGNPPTAAQVKGPQIQDWAEEGFLANLDPVANAEGWDDFIPKVVADIMKYRGSYVAVPVNVHRINWMWANPAVFADAGADIPTEISGSAEMANKVRATGKIPVAWGGQPWQEATVFEIVVAAIGGTDFYIETMVEASPDAMNSPMMIECLSVFKGLKQYTDPGAPGRDWNLATAMVIKGDAAVQFMGDWAKGEFTAAGKKPDVDYVAVPAPGTAHQFIFNIDSFIMFDVKDAGAKAAQQAMARLILEPEFQEVFNINKGSIPVRMGMPEAPFDIPARLSMRDFSRSAETGDLIPSMAHEMATKRAIRGAIMDTVSAYYNSDMSAAEAAQQMQRAVRSAR
jgi:glucose/mannose transport system substrate-binding protein